MFAVCCMLCFFVVRCVLALVVWCLFVVCCVLFVTCCVSSVALWL